jgi:hypothetical protein
MVRRIAAILLMGPALDANYLACAADAQTYETLGLSREAVRERKDAKILKRGVSNKLTPAMKNNREGSKKSPEQTKGITCLDGSVLHSSLNLPRENAAHLRGRSTSSSWSGNAAEFCRSRDGVIL